MNAFTDLAAWGWLDWALAVVVAWLAVGVAGAFSLRRFGFVSHVQGELKQKAQEAGCDVVMPRSAFSQTLPQLLRRHGAPEDLQQ